MSSVTCSAGVNIAVIKYWGKRDENLILPLNSSLSATLDQADMRTVTTVTAVPASVLTEDEIYLNGKKEDINNVRYQRVLKELRSRANEVANIKKEEWPLYKVRIVSENNFPTAAGLASSASGYCCLVFALANLFAVKGDISPIVRMGSGSACRSLFGGWSKWEMGTLADGSDSIALPVAPESHWPEMEILVLVVNDAKKETSSTSGMEQSVKTSKLLEKRVKDVVPQRMKDMENAILNRDYHVFADLTMKDSDDFHAVCADTIPPIYYMNDISKQIVQVVNQFNSFNKTNKAAYTYDAGPNAVIYILKENVVPFLAMVLHYFAPTKTPLEQFIKNPQILKEAKDFVLPNELKSEATKISPIHDGLKYILATRPGPGPMVLSPAESLADPQTGLPKKN